MRRWLFLGLLAIPVVDIVLLVWVAGRIGAVATVALVVLTGLIGLLLVRAEGRHTLRQLQRRAGAGEVPTDELLDGALLVAAGAFLLTPGLVTDVLGFLLVVPITRVPIRLAVKRWVVGPRLDRRSGGFVTGTVYTGGFPFDAEDVANPFTDGPFDGETEGGPGDDPVDLGPDAYDIDIESPEDERRNGNA